MTEGEPKLPRPDSDDQPTNPTLGDGGGSVWAQFHQTAALLAEPQTEREQQTAERVIERLEPPRPTKTYVTYDNNFNARHPRRFAATLAVATWGVAHFKKKHFGKAHDK